MPGEPQTSLFHQKTRGALYGSLIGDAIGTPTEGLDYPTIEKRFGRVADFDGDGTDDTIMRNLLATALIRTDGFATSDDWARVWVERWDDIFGDKRNKFFSAVLNTAGKLRTGIPREAALGNLPSSSSAMCIAPVGVVNACNPQAAAAQAYNIAGLIHIHDVGFCQDGAAAVAAAVAAAFSPDATTASVIDAARDAIVPDSGREMRSLIRDALAIADEAGEYKAFRKTIYERKDRFFRKIFCDSRETVPLTLALFQLADGDVEKTVVYAANFGRDADTTGAMGGAIAGALQGIGGIRTDWVEKARRLSGTDNDTLAGELVDTARRKFEMQGKARKDFNSIQ